MEPAPDGLALHVTGMREPLRLPLPAPDSGKAPAPGHADQLLSSIAYAAEHTAATLIKTVVARRLRKPAPTLAELPARVHP
ncbi:hypothetical protein ACIA6C_15775 [Streptomyces sp. NPDC051578]|uniref:hypothetical protein n=1 Tax=Streptomyces sp. NPDC051578 TaxID=3365662 RepID=UPI00378749DE